MRTYYVIDYKVYPHGAEWHVSSGSSGERYTYRKRMAAVSMAESLASEGDTVTLFRFDSGRCVVQPV